MASQKGRGETNMARLVIPRTKPAGDSDALLDPSIFKRMLNPPLPSPDPSSCLMGRGDPARAAAEDRGKGGGGGGSRQCWTSSRCLQGAAVLWTGLGCWGLRAGDC